MQSSRFPGLHKVCLFLKIWQGSEYVLGSNYGRDLSILEFKICHVSAYARVAEGSEHAWIWLNKALINCSDYGRAFNMPPVLIIAGLGIWQGLEYARVTQGAEYGWISLNMPEYALIWLDILEYGWIYLNKQSCEYARILNVSDPVQSIRSLYKLLSSYRDRGVLRPLSNI